MYILKIYKHCRKRGTFTRTIPRGRREGMTVKTCDKCGTEINTNLTTNTILPMFSISRIKGSPVMGFQSVDLCPKCEKILAEWLNDNEKSPEREEC